MFVSNRFALALAAALTLSPVASFANATDDVKPLQENNLITKLPEGITFPGGWIDTGYSCEFMPPPHLCC